MAIKYTLPKKNKFAEKLLSLYKGINPELYYSLAPKTREFVLTKTIKELCLLAESTNESAGATLYQLMKESQQTGKLPILDIESLIEYGRLFEDLSEEEKDLARNMEIQQELSHFSRIMNLDGVIFNEGGSSLENVVDFSRFLELLAERREDRRGTSLSTWARPTNLSFSITNSPVCGLLEEKRNGDQIALLAVKEQRGDFSPKIWLSEYARIANRFGTKTSTLLFDYLLSLSNKDNDLSFVSVQAKAGDKITSVEVSGSGGCGVLITKPSVDNVYKRNVVKRITVGKKDSWGFGKTEQSSIKYISSKVRGDSLNLYCFHPQAWETIQDLNDESLNQVLNTPFNNGWFNQSNAMKDFLREKNINPQLVDMTTKKPQKGAFNKVKKTSLKNSINSLSKTKEFKNLIKTSNLVIESAHLHADRSPGEEQWECVKITNILNNSLKRSGFRGSSKSVVMVDELHVVNRLDYAAFQNKLESKGLHINNLLLESSPLVRLIAIDILKKLANKEPFSKNFRVVKRGGNLYLELPQERVSIELVASQGKNAIIGCILFDVAFTLYKSNPKFYQDKYQNILKTRKNIDEEIIKFYNREPDPKKRNKFVTKFYTPIPSWEELKTSSDREITLTSDALVLNILEEFYRPQQVKVNRFLKILGQPTVYSLYYNLESQNITLERSGE